MLKLQDPRQKGTQRLADRYGACYFVFAAAACGLCVYLGEGGGVRRSGAAHTGRGHGCLPGNCSAPRQASHPASKLCIQC